MLCRRPSTVGFRSRGYQREQVELDRATCSQILEVDRDSTPMARSVCQRQSSSFGIWCEVKFVKPNLELVVHAISDEVPALVVQHWTVCHLSAAIHQAISKQPSRDCPGRSPHSGRLELGAELSSSPAPHASKKRRPVRSKVAYGVYWAVSDFLLLSDSIVKSIPRC